LWGMVTLKPRRSGATVFMNAPRSRTMNLQ
jgi:hypothetical protein